MVDTLPNVYLPAGVWVDLYAATGIGVGTQIDVYGLVGSGVRLHAAAAAPTGNYGYRPVLKGEELTNEAGDAGAWAISPSVDSWVNVRVTP